MDIPIWKDRVWLTLLLGPFVWVALFASRSGDAGWQLGVYWAWGLCLTIGLVSAFFDTVRGRRALQTSN